MSRMEDLHTDVVCDYISSRRKRLRDEMDFFRTQPTLKAAIGKAALCLMADGRKHPHQWRVPPRVLQQFEKLLQGRADSIQQAGDFEALFRIVARASEEINGVGALTIYDVAHRIGAFLGHEPARVYLHAGTRKGAAALVRLGVQLNIRCESLDPNDLPTPYRSLTASEIEDCLCIYASNLSGTKVIIPSLATSSRNCSPTRPRFPGRRC